MAIIFDAGLLARREAETLTPADLCKIALCTAVAEALPDATVYTSAQAQGTTAPAVFVRFGKMAARTLLGDIERTAVEAQCRYLPLTAEDDGENEEAMQALLDALLAICGGEVDFCSRSRIAKRTDTGATVTGDIRFDIRREDAAKLAEDLMQTLELAAAAG